MDAQFEQLRAEVETDLSRPIDQVEEIELKALYFFGKGVKLKNQLESEPQHISEILPGVMQNIKDRCNQYRREHGLPLLGKDRKTSCEHRKRIFSATRDFMDRSKRSERRKPRKQKTKQGRLW